MKVGSFASVYDDNVAEEVIFKITRAADNTIDIVVASERDAGENNAQVYIDNEGYVDIGGMVNGNNSQWLTHFKEEVQAVLTAQGSTMRVEQHGFTIFASVRDITPYLGIKA